MILKRIQICLQVADVGEDLPADLATSPDDDVFPVEDHDRRIQGTCATKRHVQHLPSLGGFAFACQHAIRRIEPVVIGPGGNKVLNLLTIHCRIHLFLPLH